MSNFIKSHKIFDICSTSFRCVEKSNHSIQFGRQLKHSTNFTEKIIKTTIILIQNAIHLLYISLCRNPSAWCSKHHIFRFLILESGLYGIVNQYVPPDDDGDSLKVVHTTILYTLFDVYFSPWVDTSLENILCLLIFFFHLTWFFKERLWMHSTLSIQSYAYYLQLDMLIKWQTLWEHFYCPIQHMFYCYFIWFYQIEFNCNTNLK